MTPKIRITMSQRGDEIRGTVNLEGEVMFALEALAATIEILAKTAGVTPVEMARDLYYITAGKVK